MKILTIILFAVFLVPRCTSHNTIKILILSGRNNHNWEETTACLEKIFLRDSRFETTVTLRPDTLSEMFLKNFDVVVSNWNSWPENDYRWPSGAENAWVNFVNKGGGWVTFHSSTSVFYNWPEFREMTTASWETGTRHDKPDTTRIIIDETPHAITKGLGEFEIFDEMWINARQNENYRILAYATDNSLQQQKISPQPAVMVRNIGKGRIFHTILGHDARAMENNGFAELMQRGTEWAATGKVRLNR